NIAKHLYEFGNFRLDPSEYVLLCSGQPVNLTPKAFQLLSFLVENSGHLVTKEKLRNRLWPNTHVDEANLVVTVRMLRKALGADPAGQGYIQTVPRQGYRFSADVRPIISRPRRVDEGKGIQHDEHVHEIVRSEISNQFNDTQRDNRFFEALANRYRAILAVGMAALGFAFWDLFLNHPSEVKLIRDLSVILLASVTIYLSDKARSTITVNIPVRVQAA